jgi:sulfur carrier protein
MSQKQRVATHILCVNGAPENLAVETVSEFLATREISLRGIAVALNGRVVSRAEWDSTVLKDGDAIEIVRAMQGG